MKCNRCERTPQTAADLEHCLTCVNDGTAREASPYPATMALAEVLEHKPGLASRFSPEPAAQTEAFADQPPAPKPGLMARLRKKRS